MQNPLSLLLCVTPLGQEINLAKPLAYHFSTHSCYIMHHCSEKWRIKYNTHILYSETNVLNKIADLVDIFYLVNKKLYFLFANLAFFALCSASMWHSSKGTHTCSVSKCEKDAGSIVLFPFCSFMCVFTDSYVERYAMHIVCLWCKYHLAYFTP